MTTESVRTAVGWPYDAVDAGRARAAGWRPVPFREFVVKVHQR